MKDSFISHFKKITFSNKTSFRLLELDRIRYYSRQ